MKMTIEGVENLLSSLGGVRDQIRPQMEAAIEAAAKVTEDVMKDEAPKVSGSLQAAITSSTKRSSDTVTAEIGPDDSRFGGRDVGRTVEAGRRANSAPPPAADLMARYGLSLAQAIAAAKKIGLMGTDGNPFVERTFERVEPLFEEIGVRAMYDMADRF